MILDKYKKNIFIWVAILIIINMVFLPQVFAMNNIEKNKMTSLTPNHPPDITVICFSKDEIRVNEPAEFTIDDMVKAIGLPKTKL